MNRPLRIRPPGSLSFTGRFRRSAWLQAVFLLVRDTLAYGATVLCITPLIVFWILVLLTVLSSSEDVLGLYAIASQPARLQEAVLTLVAFAVPLAMTLVGLFIALRPTFADTDECPGSSNSPPVATAPAGDNTLRPTAPL